MKKTTKSTKNTKTRQLASSRRIKAKVSAKTKKKSAKAKKAKKAHETTKTSASAAFKNGSIPVYDLNGKPAETITLDPMFYDGAVNTDVIYQAVVMYQANEREGTASTKDRGHVRGGGKKPWKQKGTGQARHGSRRSPIWRGGGVTFGPSPRDYSYSIPQQVRRKAVVEAVKDRLLNGKLTLVSRFEPEAPKTKLVAGVLKTFKLEKPLFLVEQKTQNLQLASRNIPGVSVKTSDEVNALDVASHEECVMTKGAYAGLLKRFKT